MVWCAPDLQQQLAELRQQLRDDSLVHTSASADLDQTVADLQQQLTELQQQWQQQPPAPPELQAQFQQMQCQLQLQQERMRTELEDRLHLTELKLQESTTASSQPGNGTLCC